MTKYDFYWKFSERPKRIIKSFLQRFNTDIMLDKNAVIIQREVNKHRNELVYEYPFRVVRLLGWTDQYEDEDYYYVIYDNEYGVVLTSCVGGFIWLKNRLSSWDYCNADTVFRLNTPPDKEIINLIEDMDIKLK